MRPPESSEPDRAYAEHTAEFLRRILAYRSYPGSRGTTVGEATLAPHPDDGWEFEITSASGTACTVNVYPGKPGLSSRE